MDILQPSERLRLLEYMTRLKFRLPEWLIAEVKIRDESGLSAPAVADTLRDLFQAYDGRVLICNATELLMLIEWGRENAPQKLAKTVRTRLPEESCEASIVPPTREGIKKIALTIAPRNTDSGPFLTARLGRQGNVVLVADDDMYMRSLARAGLKGVGEIFEVAEGSQVAEAYKAHNPDLVLLDIHMPGLGGPEALEQLRRIDPHAYVVMMSADSSPENVQKTRAYGARGFIVKPFTKAKLMEYVEACPTVS